MREIFPSCDRCGIIQVQSRAIPLRASPCPSPGDCGLWRLVASLQHMWLLLRDGCFRRLLGRNKRSLPEGEGDSAAI